MNIGTQRELLRRFFELRAAHTTSLAAAPYRQNAAVYTDPERLACEERLLLRGRPLVAALSADVPSTGDCLATEVAGVPLLLIRGEDAEVRAFLNICRHRGGRVFTGRGRPGRALKCPYHSWAYDLNGDLLGQPLARDAFEPVDRCELGLRPVPVAERFGLILVRLGGDDAPIDVERELCGLGTELGEWEFVGDQFGVHDRGLVMRKEVVSLLERPESEWELKPFASVVYVLFPTAILNLPMTGHAELWEMYPEPGDPHRTRVSVRYFTPREPASDDELAFWDANVRFTTKVVFEEDFGQQQDIHRSLRSGLMDQVIYGRNEPVLIHHHVEAERALAGEATRPRSLPV